MRASVSAGAGRLSRWPVLPLAALIGLGTLVPAQANDWPDRGGQPPHIVYVQTNTPGAGQNGVLAYRRDSGGNLTALRGSPFASGGAGFFDSSFKLGPFDSDQNVVVDPLRGLLFSVNGGSNSIAVFRIRPNGGLSPVRGSPFPSGGINPVGVGIKGDFLVVANKDADPAQPDTLDRPGYNTFRIGFGGYLIPVPGSAVRLAEGTSPTQPLTTNTGRFVFSSEFPTAGVFDVLRLNVIGGLRLKDSPAVPPLPGSTATSGPAPLGLWAHPKLPVLYAGLTAASRLGVFRWDRAGTLAFVGSVPTGGAAPCWVRVNRAGSRIYVADTGSNAISVFDSGNPTAPVELQTLPLKGPGSVFQITLDLDERFLYALDQRAAAAQTGESNSLHVLRVLNDGRLREVDSSPLVLPVPADSRPQGVAAL